MRAFGAALAVSVLLLVPGCGSSSDRPSQDEVSKALQKGGEGSILGSAGSKLSDKQADCIAKVLVDSKISDKGLQALVDGKKNYKASKQDASAATSVSSKMVKCVSTGLSTQ